jgi:hypothetical protein
LLRSNPVTNTKYEFVPGDTITIAPGRTVKRIRALVAIASLCVQVGDLGGYIEAESALQTSGNAWVYGDAQVYGNARVYGDAWVSGDGTKTSICLSGLAWHVTITDDQMSIGCQSHALSAWSAFTDAEIDAMDPGALEWWGTYRETVLGLARSTGRLS